MITSKLVISLQGINIKNIQDRNSLPSSWDSVFSVPRARVPSLELRSHKWHGAAKKKKKRIVKTDQQEKETKHKNG